jgi:hypothetical protein
LNPTSNSTIVVFVESSFARATPATSSSKFLSRVFNAMAQEAREAGTHLRKRKILILEFREKDCTRLYPHAGDSPFSDRSSCCVRRYVTLGIEQRGPDIPVTIRWSRMLSEAQCHTRQEHHTPFQVKVRHDCHTSLGGSRFGSSATPKRPEANLTKWREAPSAGT